MPASSDASLRVVKAVILAGGYGTRISEESAVRPKPMVEIGGKPILWHIMKIYAAGKVDEFVICAGYRSYMIKEFFANYALHTTDVTVDLRDNRVEWHTRTAEPWRVTIVDTGDGTMTGGRLKRVRDYIGDETFFMTYGDCVADIDVCRLLEQHRSWGGLVTLTAIQPPGRFGAMVLSEGEHTIESFQEKPHGDGAWVNGGFFVVEPEALDYIKNDATVWERAPLEAIAHGGKLCAYRHEGFWHPMDTLRDKTVLEELWASGRAPWKVW
jgi:glucose-1-phosphate cytidylyltransferase